jgi:hypothetical protein
MQLPLFIISRNVFPRDWFHRPKGLCNSNHPPRVGFIVLKFYAIRTILLAADGTAAAGYGTINKAIRREFTIQTNNRLDGTKWIQTTTQGISAKTQCTCHQETMYGELGTESTAPLHGAQHHTKHRIRTKITQPS